MKRAMILSGLALAVLLAIQPAMAVCPNSAGFSQAPKDLSANYNYVVFGTTSSTQGGAQDGSLAVGHFWQLGARADANEGTTPTGDWFKFYYAGQWYIDGNWASLPGIGPTPTSCASGNPMAIVMQDRALDGSTAFFAAGAVDSFQVCPREWDMSKAANSNCSARPTRTWGNWNGMEFPRPHVTASSRVGTDIVLDLQLADVAAGFYNGGNAHTPYETITGYNIYTQTLPRGTTPGRELAGWVFSQTVLTAAGGATIPGFTVNCADTGTNVWVAAGLQFDGGLESDYVSAATSVECDPTLADPRFKLIDKDAIDKKGKGPKDR